MPSDLSLLLGSLAGDHLVLSPQRRAAGAPTDYWDGNWVTCTLDVRAGGFRGHVETDLRAEDFPRFRTALCALHQTLGGEARFETMEASVSIHLVGNGRGGIEARCTVLDAPGTGNRLDFSLTLDQTYLPEMVAALDRITAAIPVIGDPSTR